MKLFIVTCLKDYQKDLYQIFKQAKINVFSATDIVGFKQSSAEDLLADWFASGDEQFDSLMLFSFTADANTQHAMELIKKHNDEKQTSFPVRAFVLPVEKSI